MKTAKFSMIGCVLVLGLAAMSAQAVVIDVPIVADQVIVSNQDSAGGATFKTDKIGAEYGMLKRALMKADLPSDIQTVNSATLLVRFSLTQGDPNDEYLVSAFRLKKEWFESDDFGPSWTENIDDNTAGYTQSFWEIDGADGAMDRALTASDTHSIANEDVPNFPSGLWGDFDVTSDVQMFADGTAANNGWILAALDLEDLVGDNGKHRISLYTKDEDVKIDRHPFVRLDYTPVPEPASMALIGLGGLALLRRRSA